MASTCGPVSDDETRTRTGDTRFQSCSEDAQVLCDLQVISADWRLLGHVGICRILRVSAREKGRRRSSSAFSSGRSPRSAADRVPSGGALPHRGRVLRRRRQHRGTQRPPSQSRGGPSAMVTSNTRWTSGHPAAPSRASKMSRARTSAPTPRPRAARAQVGRRPRDRARDRPGPAAVHPPRPPAPPSLPAHQRRVGRAPGRHRARRRARLPAAAQRRPGELPVRSRQCVRGRPRAAPPRRQRAHGHPDRVRRPRDRLRRPAHAVWSERRAPPGGAAHYQPLPLRASQHRAGEAQVTGRARPRSPPRARR
jgi:hypothetical protein